MEKDTEKLQEEINSLSINDLADLMLVIKGEK